MWLRTSSGKVSKPFIYTARRARSVRENGVRRNGTSQPANGQNRNALPRRRRRHRRQRDEVSRGGGESARYAGVGRSLLGETPRGGGTGTRDWTQKRTHKRANTRTKNAGSARDPQPSRAEPKGSFQTASLENLDSARRADHENGNESSQRRPEVEKNTRFRVSLLRWCVLVSGSRLWGLVLAQSLGNS